MIQKKDQMHPEDRRNLMIFALCALVVWFSYNHFLIQPKIEALRVAKLSAEAERAANPLPLDNTATRRPREEVLSQSERLPFGNKEVSGSIALIGGRVDDLQLLNYARELHGKERVELLSPSESNFPLYAEFGWQAGDAAIKVPDATSRWQVTGGAEKLSPGAPVVLFWDNGQGLRFEREIALDEKYMFTVTQRVVNNTGRAVSLYPYSLLSEQGTPEEYKGRQVHEGPIGYIDGKLQEITYGKMIKKVDLEEYNATSGWIGITELYWFSSIIPAQGEKTKFRFLHKAPPTEEGRHRFQVDTLGDARVIQPGASGISTFNLFAGAKEVVQLEAYEKSLNIPHFDLAVNFGWLYFLTKPLFHILHFFYLSVGNMGVAIIMLTVLVRLCVFPLANISFRSFAKLRKIAPEMKSIREEHGEDRVKLQQELVKLYEREKVNPMAGCLPMVIQIPIFFALFKVMVITIELRHAPFFGWIHDLSAADPTSVFNLFGLIPWNPPLQLMIGAWPCMMLGFMLLQRNMNPPPQDKMQAYMINVMPFFITYIMHGFAAGLVIYYTFSNALSIVQQYVIMRSMGVKVRFFRRLKVEKDLEKQVSTQPAVHPEVEMIEEKVEDAMFGETDRTQMPDAGGDETPRTGSRKNPAAKKKKR